MAIKDSGERTVFPNGSMRDMHEGKGDMASLPWEAVLRLSKHYEAGAKKYKRWNYRGLPVSSFIDSACRHIAKYQCGCDDEDHLAAAAFNILGAMLVENINPELQDLPLREGKETFNYFADVNDSDNQAGPSREEMRDAILAYCRHHNCDNCSCIPDENRSCFNCVKIDDLARNYEIVKEHNANECNTCTSNT